jgi:hypothetical protein
MATRQYKQMAIDTIGVNQMAQVHIYRIEPYYLGAGHSKVMELTFFFRFEDDENQIVSNRSIIEGCIERHQGFDQKGSYLVLHPTHTFTINYQG